MSAELFVATLGQAPGAITMALDRLQLRIPTLDTVALLHTSPTLSAISEQFELLQRELAHERPAYRVLLREITDMSGQPLIDIVDEPTSRAYFRGVWSVLREFKQQGYTIHLLIAGGRKAMSIYAMLAATFALQSGDRVWTIHSPDAVIKAQAFWLRQVPIELRDNIKLISLPIFPLRLAPVSGDMRFEEIEQYMERRQHLGEDFLNQLSPKEQLVAAAIRQNPYAENKLLGQHLFIDARTVETHLQNIYQKMRFYLDRGDQLPKHQMRQVLIDLISGRL